MRSVTLFLCLILSIGLHAQPVDSVAFEGANALLIANNYQVNQNLFLLQTRLHERGYDVVVDRKKKTMITRDSLMHGGGVSYVITARIQTGEIILTGQYQTAVVTSILSNRQEIFRYDILYEEKPNPLSQKMFRLLEDIAKNVEGTLSYIKEKKKRTTLLGKP